MTLATVPRYREGAVSTVGDHAVVVGASVAGLLAARVLADGFETVTVLERDTLPEGIEHRRGVPQGSQLHALQKSGRATMADLFPGFGEDLVSAGALLLDAGTDLAYYEAGDFLAPGTERMPAYTATRPLFEHVIRRRVAGRDDVDLRDGCQVRTFIRDEDDDVRGVAVRGPTGEIEADLVVDATGRRSHTPTWLEEHGYRAPSVAEVEIDVAYSTTAVRRPPEDRRAILQVASAPHYRGCAVFPVEGDRWLVNVHGVHGDHPPATHADMAAFADSLPVPHAKRLLETRQALRDEPDFYPFPSNRRHSYEDLDRFPDGLVVLGDAVASFNPIYGQGMSVAALQALQLHHALAADGLADLPSRFFDRVSDVVDVAWSMAVGSDHRYPETTGPKPSGAGLFDRYVSRLARAAHDDGTLRDALFRVITMERPPRSLLRPSVVARVLGPWPSDVPELLGTFGRQYHDRQ